MKNRILYIVATAALIATSCSENSGLVDHVTKPVAINFIEEHKQSRAGNLDDNGGFSDGDMIGVFGYQKENNVAWENNELPQLMHNVTLTRQTFVVDPDDALQNVVNYVYNPQKMWPALPKKARFFAYYPHNSTVTIGAITPSLETNSGYPYVEVALGLSPVPVDFVTAQTDLMNKTVGTAAGGVAFNFKHRLSKLFFKVKATDLSTGLKQGETRKMYINQLAIKNIYNKAKYTFYDTEPTAGAWTEHSTTEIDGSSGATLTNAPIMIAVGENDYQDLIDPHDPSGKGSYLLMIPQVYDNVEFEVIYTVERLNETGGCEDRVVTIRRFPASVNWKSGQVYTYYLEFGFLDINEAALKLSLSVKDWVTGGYEFEMGKK